MPFPLKYFGEQNMDASAKLQKLVNSADNPKSKFTPTPLQISRAYNILNACIFEGKLKKPHIIVKLLKDEWGICEGDIFIGNDRFTNVPVCHRIILSDSFPHRKLFLEVLVHEMIHQYQCEHLNRMDHGQTFWYWKSKLNRYNLDLFVSKRNFA